MAGRGQVVTYEPADQFEGSARPIGRRDVGAAPLRMAVGEDMAAEFGPLLDLAGEALKCFVVEEVRGFGGEAHLGSRFFRDGKDSFPQFKDAELPGLPLVM